MRLLLVLCFSLPVTAVHALSVVSVPDQSTVVKNLFELLGGPQTPANCSTAGQRPICSFAEACSAIQDRTSSPYLYENAEGGKIVNPRVLDTLRSLRQCAQVGGLRFDPNAQRYEIYKAGLRANADFRRYLSTLPVKVQRDMNKVEAELADKMVATVERVSAGEQVDFPTLRSTMEELKVKLPDDLVNKWVALQAVTNAQPSTNQLPPLPELPPSLQELADDPFNNPGVALWDGERGVKARERFTKRVGQVSSRVPVIRQRLIDYLQQRIEKYPDQKEVLERMQTRIRVADLIMPMSGTPEAETVCDSPNAFYDPYKHRVTICPQMLGMPSAQLDIVIGHELAHSVDPCMNAYSLHQLVTPAGATAYSILRPSPDGPYAGAEIDKGTAYKEHPFGKTLRCLADRDSMAAPPISRKLVKSTVKETRRLARSGQGEVQEIEEVNKILPEMLDRFMGCSHLPGKTRQQESFSDWLAIEAMASQMDQVSVLDLAGFMLDSCPMGESVAMREVAKFMIGNGCVPPNQYEGLEVSEIFSKMQQVVEWHNHQDDPHPASVDRTNRLLLQNPRIRARLGCEKAPQGKYCAP